MKAIVIGNMPQEQIGARMLAIARGTYQVPELTPLTKPGAQHPNPTRLHRRARLHH